MIILCFIGNFVSTWQEASKAGVVLQTVKDIVALLVGDDLITSDKVWKL